MADILGVLGNNLSRNEPGMKRTKKFTIKKLQELKFFQFFFSVIENTTDFWKKIKAIQRFVAFFRNFGTKFLLFNYGIYIIFKRFQQILDCKYF